MNIHDSLEHVGKRPRRGGSVIEAEGELIQLRKEMEEAVSREDYERASEIRDQIKEIQEGDS